ncbi:MAG: hypothetical protein M3R51_05540 [Candidatus Eremiobacteraeota bacterium]|nr:hypothetical protein [Candidatus Eremiobacteraeota bacterium]
MWADTHSRFRPLEELSLEHVRREVRLGSHFGAEAFDRAFDRFVQTYNVSPNLARCSPDVLDRYCTLFEATDEAARMREVRYRGIPIYAAVLARGIIAFEGEVDEDRMGDW